MISVIIPAYNAASHLPVALASLEEQDCRDFEVVVVDDGSLDATADVARSWADRLPSLTVIRTDNQGPLLARMVGVAQARGEYVMFLDSDDRYRREAVAVVAERVAVSRPDVLMFRLESGTCEKCESPQVLPVGWYEGPDIQVVRRVICEGQVNELCIKAFNRALFDPVVDKNRYTGIRYGEDLLQLILLMDRVRTVESIGDILYRYSPSDSSIIRRFDASHVRSLEVAVSVLLTYGARWGRECREASVRGVLRQYLRLMRIAALYGDRSSIVVVADSMNMLGLHGLSGSGLRFDHRLRLAAVKTGQPRLIALTECGSEHLKSSVRAVHRSVAWTRSTGRS